MFSLPDIIWFLRRGVLKNRTRRLSIRRGYSSPEWTIQKIINTAEIRIFYADYMKGWTA